MKLAICLLSFVCVCVASNQTYAQQQRLKPGIYVPNDTLYQRIYHIPAGPNLLPLPMVVTKDHIYQLRRFRFVDIEELRSYIETNKTYVLKRSSINKTHRNNDEMTICIKYPFFARGELTKFYDTRFSGKIIGDSIVNYRMVEPYPAIYYRKFHRRINKDFTYELTPKTMVYKPWIIEELETP